jgi:acetyltransferase-like isoleucine patch superfamily enzyme
MWRLARTAKALVMRARFRLWVTRLRLLLRRHGGSLVVDAPATVHLGAPPDLKVYPGRMEGPGTTTLRFGRDVHVGKRLTIELAARGNNSLIIGDGVELLNNIRLEMRGGEIDIGAGTRLRDAVLIKSDGRVELGPSVTIGPAGIIHCTEAVTFEEAVGLGERVSVTDSDHVFDGVDRDFLKKDLVVEPVRVGRQTMIAFNSSVLRGARVGANSAIGANSVVRSGEYPDASVLAGNPAKVVKDLRERTSRT